MWGTVVSRCAGELKRFLLRSELLFFELNVLLRNRVVFAERELFRQFARVLLLDVIKARASGAGEFDVDRIFLRHDLSSKISIGYRFALRKSEALKECRRLRRKPARRLSAPKQERVETIF